MNNVIPILRPITQRVRLPLLPHDREAYLEALSEKTSKLIAAKEAQKAGRQADADALFAQCDEIDERISEISSRRPRA